jgi:hypothetical protein
MVTIPKGLGAERDYAGEGQQHIKKTDPSSCQRGRPTKTRPQLSESNKYLVMSPRWGSTPRLTDWLTVSRNVTLTLTNVWISRVPEFQVSSYSRVGKMKLRVQVWRVDQRATAWPRKLKIFIVLNPLPENGYWRLQQTEDTSLCKWIVRCADYR